MVSSFTSSLFNEHLRTTGRLLQMSHSSIKFSVVSRVSEKQEMINTVEVHQKINLTGKTIGTSYEKFIM